MGNPTCFHILSDYGTDAVENTLYTALLAQHFPGVFIFHSNQPAFKKGDMMAPGFFLKLVEKDMPKGTLHLCLLHIESKLPEKYVLVVYGETFFLAPDNGTIPIALGDASADYYQLPLPEKPLQDVMKQIYLPAIQKLTQEGITAFAPEVNPKKFIIPLPALSNNTYRLTVLFNDSHGNAYLNMGKEEFETITLNKKFAIRIGMRENIEKIASGYHEVPEGNKLALFGLGNVLQLAVNCGSAAQYHGLKTGQQVLLLVE